MPLLKEQLNELEGIAVAAAGRAGAMIRQESGKERDVMRKDGGDTIASQVVTEVDLEAERLILEALGGSIEAHGFGLLSEEKPDDDSRHRCEFFWCIDPLDGTLPFVEGAAGYSVSIGLVSREGVAQVGVVFDPVTETLYQATRGGGARRNGEPWIAGGRDQRGVDGPLNLFVDRHHKGNPALLEKAELVAAKAGLKGVKETGYGAAVMNVCWVAENAPAVYFKFPKKADGGGSIWDYAATACLFGELGLPVTDIYGAPLQLNRRESTFMNRDGLVIATDEDIAGAARELWAGQ